MQTKTPPPEQPNPIAVITNTLGAREMQQQFQRMLPKTVDFDKFMQAALTAVNRAAHVIARCDRQSVYNSIADAASRGLLPDGRQGALVPFREKVRGERGGQDYYITKCQFLIMPEGIIEMAARSGATVYAVSVHAHDTVRLWNDAAGQHFEHDYNPFGDRGERLGAVAVGKTRSGQVFVEAMSMGELERVRMASKQKDDAGNPTGAWRDWPERMEQKSALHRLNKRMPGISLDDDPEYGGERSLLRLAEMTSQGSLAPPTQQPPADVPRGTPGRPERSRGLQRLVDNQGAIYAGDAGSEPTQPENPPPVAGTAPPSPAPPPPTQDPF